MSLKLNERYPGRFNNPSADYPLGSFKNRTAPSAKDGSYLEKDWANDKEGFFQSLLTAAGISADGSVDTVTKSQFFDALKKIISDSTPAAATESAAGVIRIATQLQSDDGASDSLAITPKKLATWFANKSQATETSSGVARISNPAQVAAGVDDSTIITPKKLFSVDPWALQPIGVPIPVWRHLGDITVPSRDKGYRYIKLTASDPYNTGLLASEVVSGSEPLLLATAVINMAGSPLNGVTVSLINTERRVIRAAETSGELLFDAFQGHFHAQAVGEDGVNGNTPNTSSTFDAGLTSGNVGIRRTTGPTTNLVTIRGAITDSANGTARAGGETRAKSISATFYLRIK